MGGAGGSRDRKPEHAAGGHTPTVLNQAFAISFYFWDGRAGTLEEQAKGPIQADVEMNMPLDALVERLSGIEGYREWFARVFPESGITEDTIIQAIATYERTVVSSYAPFDAWVDGDESAISDSAKRGFRLFTDAAECSACHTGWNFTDNEFHDIGLPTQDIGRAKVDEQGAATREIAENVQRAASGTQDVSSNIVEVSRGTQETGTASQQVLSAAEQLGAQSDELQAAVASFLDRVKAA
jgi:cytochrome c peroxidase